MAIDETEAGLVALTTLETEWDLRAAPLSLGRLAQRYPTVSGASCSTAVGTAQPAAVDHHLLSSDLTHIKAHCGEMPIVRTMEGRRFDIIRVGAGWWLTDSGVTGLAFPNAAEAIAEGKRRADAYDGPASVHIWDNGVPTQVHYNRGVDDSDATGAQS